MTLTRLQDWLRYLCKSKLWHDFALENIDDFVVLVVVAFILINQPSIVILIHFE